MCHVGLWGSEDSFGELVLSIYMCPRNQIHVRRLTLQALLPTDCLAGPAHLVPKFSLLLSPYTPAGAVLNSEMNRTEWPLLAPLGDNSLSTSIRSVAFRLWGGHCREGIPESEKKVLETSWEMEAACDRDTCRGS